MDPGSRYGFGTTGSQGLGIMPTQSPYGGYQQPPGGNPAMMTKTSTGKSSNTLGIIALVVAILAILLAVIMSVVWGTMASPSSNKWNLVQGTSTKNVDDFTPEPSDLYVVNNTTSELTINIKKPKTSLDGRMFMIDNTRNTGPVVIASSDLTYVDNVGHNKVAGRMTGVFLGLSSSSFERLI